MENHNSSKDNYSLFGLCFLKSQNEGILQILKNEKRNNGN